jgi:hypothetical protein
MTTANITRVAAALGRLGGKSKSPAKRRASANNGKLGGRPKGNNMKLIATTVEQAISNEQIQRVLRNSTAAEVAAYLSDAVAVTGIILDNQQTYDVMVSTGKWSRDEIIEAMIPATGWNEAQLRANCN